MPKTLVFIPSSLAPQITQIPVGDTMTVGDAVAPSAAGTYLVTLGDAVVDELTVLPPSLTMTLVSAPVASWASDTITITAPVSSPAYTSVTYTATVDGSPITVTGNTATVLRGAVEKSVIVTATMRLSGYQDLVSTAATVVVPRVPLPQALGQLQDVYIRINQPEVTYNLAPDFIGDGLVFSVDPSSEPLEQGDTISAAGIFTTQANEFAAPRTIVVRATDILGRFVTDSFTYAAADLPATMAAPTLTPVAPTQFTIARAAAPSGNGLPIIRYDARYYLQGSTDYIEVLDISPVQSVSGTPAQTYRAETRAVTAVGPGAWGAFGTVTLASAGTFIGSTSLDGDWIEVDAPSGFTNGNVAIVNPSMVTITQTVPSVDNVGVANSRTLPVLAGYRADVVAGKIRIWTRGNISNIATAVSINVAIGGVTDGAFSNTVAISGAILNQTTYGVYTPRLRLNGIVQGQHDLRVEKDIVNLPFYVEAGGYDQSGGGLFEVSVTNGTTTQVRYSIGGEMRSRFMDHIYLGYAARATTTDMTNPATLADRQPTRQQLIDLATNQWNKNGNRGLGVLSHDTPFNPADFADGPLTVTARLYSHAGGQSNVTSETWEVFNNAGGTYTERVAYVSPTGNDSTGDGSIGAPYATINLAARRVGASIHGATRFSISRVYLVGSGNSAAPNVYSVVAGNYPNANSRPGISDTYLTIQPAPGSTFLDTHVQPATNAPAPEIRRVKFKDLSIRIDGGQSFDSREFINSNKGNHFPADTNPQTACFDGCVFHHSLTRTGHLFSASSYLIGSGWSGLNVHFINHTVRDVSKEGHSVLGSGLYRNVALIRTMGDTLKGPKGMMHGVFIYDNIAPATVMALDNIVGTISPGDTVTGARSNGTAVVTELRSFTTSGSTKYRLIINSLTGRFKEDDAKRHHAVTVADGSAFVAGQPIRLGSGTVDRMVLRKEGNLLRLDGPNDTVTLVTAGQVLNQAATGASSPATANSVRLGGILFSSGASANYSAVHPDLVQVQAFYPQRILITPVSGTLAVGQQINKDGSTAFVQAVETITGRGPSITVGGGSVAWFGSDEGLTFSTTTGQSFVFNGTYDVSPGAEKQNLVMQHVCALYVEGAPAFAENGSNGLLFKNMMYASNNGSRDNAAQFGRTQQFWMVHCSIPQRPLADRSGASLDPRSGTVFRANIAQDINNSRAGQLADANHMTIPDVNPTISNATSGAVSYVTPIPPDDDVPAFGNFGLVPGQANIERGVRDIFARYDAFGNDRPLTGASLGAVQEWITTSPAVVAPTLVASDSAAATNVAMPAGQLAGHLAVLSVGRADAGGFVTPSGWTLKATRAVPSGGTVSLFERVTAANGETTPTIAGAAWSSISVWANSPGIGATATADAPSSAAPTFGALTLQGGAKPTAMAFLFCRSGTAGTAIAAPTGYTLASGAANANGRRVFYDEDIGTIAATSSATAVAATTTGATIHAEIMSL